MTMKRESTGYYPVDTARSIISSLDVISLIERSRCD